MILFYPRILLFSTLWYYDISFLLIFIFHRYTPFDAFIRFSASFSSRRWSSYSFITLCPSFLLRLWKTSLSISISIPVSKFSLFFTFSPLFPYPCASVIVCHLLSGSFVSIVEASFDSVSRRSRFEAFIDFSYLLLFLLLPLLCRVRLLLATRLFCFSETLLSISLPTLGLQLSSEFLSISAYMYDVYMCTCI